MMRVLVLVCGMMVAAPAMAQLAGNSDKPIEITADSLEVFQDKQQAVFAGKVEAQQGEVKITGDRMVVHYRNPEQVKASGAGAQRMRQVDMEGNVFLATAKETARGSKGVYYVDQKLIRLYGDVTLTQGQNILKGSALEYNMATGYSKVVSGASSSGGQPSSGGRVKGLFLPQ